jgi:non-specific protein-tyrosine kinase
VGVVGYLSAVRKWAWLPLVLGIVAAGTAAVLSYQQTPIYQASTTVLIRPAQTANRSGSLLTLDQVAKTYAQLMTKRPLLQRVIDELELPLSLEQLQASITVKPQPDTELLDVKVQDPNPTRAASIANTLVRDFIAQIEEDQQRQISASLRGLQARISDLEDQITSDVREIAILRSRPALNPDQQARLTSLQEHQAANSASYATLLKSFEDVRSSQLARYETQSVVDPATPPKLPIRPHKLLNTLLAGALGTMLGVGLVFLIEYLDNTFKSEEQVRRSLKLPVLGMLVYRKANGGDLVTLAQPSAPASEAFREIRTNLLFSAVDRSLKTVVVTSAAPREGKTWTSANLAVTLAQAGHQVILVDADLRRPTIHRLFRKLDQRGLSNMILDGQVHPEFIQETALPTLKVICSGTPPPNPSELLGSRRMLQIVQQLSARTDILVFDTPPVNVVTDAALLAARFDATILVVEQGRTNRTAVQRARASIERVGGTIVGAVLNKARLTGTAYYYYEYRAAKGQEPTAERAAAGTPQTDQAA